jgi:hypothetical protein
MKSYGLILAAAVLALGGMASAQSQSYVVTVHPARKTQGLDRVHIQKAAIGSTEIRLWANATIDPSCNATIPAATLAVIKQPEHGSVRISDDPLYMAYPPNNPRSACNKQKVPGHQALYAANAGYHGHDHVELEGSSPDGLVRDVWVDIDVR